MKAVLIAAVVVAASVAGAAVHSQSFDRTLTVVPGKPQPAVAMGAESPLLAALTRYRDAESVLRLTEEGRILYGADTNKRSGYDYCSASIRFAEQGEFRESVRQATRALFLGEQERNTDLQAMARRDLASVYSYAGNLERAEQYANEALRLAVRDRNQVWGPVYKTLGDVKYRRGDLPGALAEYQQALRYSRDNFAPLARMSLANAYIAAGKLDEAAAQLAEVEKRSRPTPRMLRTRGNLELKRGRYEQAREAFRQSGALAQGTDEAAPRFWAAEGLARTLLAAGKRDEAIKAYLDALRLAEEVRAVFRSEEFKTGLFGDMQSVFDQAVDLLAQAGDAQGALEVSERSRARALLDMVRGRGAVAGETKAFRDPLARDFQAAALMQGLRPGEALIEYHVLPERTYAWVITRDGIRLSALAAGREALRASVETVREDLIERRAAHAGLKSAYDTLLKPLVPAGAKHLVLVPHGPLHYLPFQALHDGDRHLIESFSLSYAPSAGALAAIQERAARPGTRLLALGNPDLRDPRLSLPGAEREIGNIRSTFPEATVYLGADATKVNFIGRAEANHVVHIAAHAEADRIDPLHSRIMLAAAGERSGTLEAREVYQLKLDGAALVTLSACESGLGTVSNGDEIWGFTRSFLVAGTSSIVASLWPVSDDSTETLMTRFYADMPKAGAAQALRSAQIAVLKDERYSHPSFWAAFNLIGAYR
jgi:CHAT domain-containing protein/predicted negative regulator of RcsB-dependent stress response